MKRFGAFLNNEGIKRNAFSIVSAILSLVIVVLGAFLIKDMLLEMPVCIAVIVAFAIYVIFNLCVCVADKFTIKYKVISCAVATAFVVICSILFLTSENSEVFEALTLTKAYTKGIVICAFVLVMLLLIMPITTSTNIGGNKFTNIICKIFSISVIILSLYVAIALCIYGAKENYAEVEKPAKLYFQNILIFVVCAIPSVLALFSNKFYKLDMKHELKKSEREKIK